MEFRILGPLEVRNERALLRLERAKPRAVLAVLLLHANEAVNAERLALALWSDEALREATKTVRVHVSRLRKAKPSCSTRLEYRRSESRRSFHARS